MPTLDFKGKQHIYAHHLTVPYRPLVPDTARSLHSTGADDNLIIHGDNIHALKALLPRYAGRVKCIYIDPPYNTGSQAWVYNDNVNSPLMQAWLHENKPVDSEDLERHDKWLCMMWPRLHFLRELLAEDGVIFVSIDDHEQWRLLGLLEDIFGEQNFVATLTFIQNLGAYPGKLLSHVTEYVRVFTKNTEQATFGLVASDSDPASDWEHDELGYFKEGSELLRRGEGGSRQDRPNMFYPVFIGREKSVSIERQSPDDTEVWPRHSDGTDGRWMWSRERLSRNLTEVIVKRHKNGSYSLITKMRPNLGDSLTVKPRSLWYKPEYSTPSGTNTIKSIFEGQRAFDFPKAVPFISDLLKFGNVGTDDIVLDSFAGSGTTAHAVLTLNKEDGSNRKFILVECEEYADTITAERVRRAINGVPNARNAQLREGLGGSFTYCTLGEPIDAEGMLTGAALPSYAALAAYLLHTASGSSAPTDALQRRNDDGLFHTTDAADYYLLYQPDMDWLRSKAAVLGEEQAERIAAASCQDGHRAIVFAVDKYMGQRYLTDMNITFCRLPYEMYQDKQGVVAWS